jgi:hypothetical protein
VTTLTVNYRTPSEVMDVAGPVIRAALPDANVPASIRSTGVPVSYGSRRDLDAIVDAWERESADGTAVVIGAPAFVPRPRVASLDAQRVKGLEFDLVVLVDPDRFGDGVSGAVDRYVAMTRATQRLVVLSGAGAAELPSAPCSAGAAQRAARGRAQRTASSAPPREGRRPSSPRRRTGAWMPLPTPCCRGSR